MTRMTLALVIPLVLGAVAATEPADAPQATPRVPRYVVRAVLLTEQPAPTSGRSTALRTPPTNGLGQIAFVAETDDGRHGTYLAAPK